MQSLVISIAVILFAGSANAVTFTGKSGLALVLRDGEKLALLVADGAAVELQRQIPSKGASSPLHCSAGYCLLGQISRDGSFGKLTGSFANPNFLPELIASSTKPQSFSEKMYFENNFTKAFAHPSHCQDKQLRVIPNVELTVHGLTAEKLYNFLNIRQSKGERVFGNGKLGANKLIFCEKLPQYDMADRSQTNGQPRPGTRPSHIEYQCYFKFSQAEGLPQSRGECNIYGSGFSAGGQ